MKRLVFDLDNTICRKGRGSYIDAEPNADVISKMREYKALGFDIIIHTSRNMRTYQGSLGKINLNTLPGILRWLELHHVPHDEVYVGKPWCGEEGFYVDDRSIRPSEFVSLTYEEIVELTGMTGK